MHDERAATASITDRQLQVLELLDRRVPIKVIASELDISQTRVNQHIAALKRCFRVNDLADLVSAYRDKYGETSPFPLTNPACTKSRLSEREDEDHFWPRVADGELVLAEAASVPLEAPWAGRNEPTVVPGVLNGHHAVFRRLVAMVGLAVAIIAAVILMIAAAVTVSGLLDGVAEVPQEQSQTAG
jgi:DNA-binding CsgD family transcriptional regulator